MEIRPLAAQRKCGRREEPFGGEPAGKLGDAAQAQSPWRSEQIGGTGARLVRSNMLAAHEKHCTVA